MIQVTDIHRSYRMGKAPPLEVLRGVTCTIESGQTYSISGPSGCGKSTLLHLIGGLDTPSQGQILWNKEQPLHAWSSQKRTQWRAENVGFIFQAYHLLNELTVLENVLLPSALAHKLNKKYALELIDKVGLSERSHHLASELSGGERQRVAIARALVNNPTLILADEPTGNLDEHTASQIIALLFDLVQQQGKTLVLVTHDASLAQRARHRLRLKEGKIVEDFPFNSPPLEGWQAKPDGVV